MIKKELIMTSINNGILDALADGVFSFSTYPEIAAVSRVCKLWNEASSTRLDEVAVKRELGIPVGSSTKRYLKDHAIRAKDLIKKIHELAGQGFIKFFAKDVANAHSLIHMPLNPGCYAQIETNNRRPVTSRAEFIVPEKLETATIPFGQLQISDPPQLHSFEKVKLVTIGKVNAVVPFLFDQESRADVEKFIRNSKCVCHTVADLCYEFAYTLQNIPFSYLKALAAGGKITKLIKREYYPDIFKKTFANYFTILDSKFASRTDQLAASEMLEYQCDLSEYIRKNHLLTKLFNWPLTILHKAQEQFQFLEPFIQALSPREREEVREFQDKILKLCEKRRVQLENMKEFKKILSFIKRTI